MTKKTTTSATFVETPSGTSPGSFQPSFELERANDFGRMAFALEATLVDRNTTAQALRSAVETFAPEFDSHRQYLLGIAQGVQAGIRKPRDLDEAIDQKAAFMRGAESATLTTAPRLADAEQLAAAAQAERFRVANNPNFWRNQT